MVGGFVFIIIAVVILTILVAPYQREYEDRKFKRSLGLPDDADLDNVKITIIDDPDAPDFLIRKTTVIDDDDEEDV